MNNSFKGLVVKSIGGFYYVKLNDGKIITCKPRGKFRKERVSPVVGDHVIISHIEDETASLDEILERKNFISRPPVANIDKLFIVVSLVDPKPNRLVIDKTIAVAEINNIKPILVFTKCDLIDDDISEDYEKSGFKIIKASSVKNIGSEEVLMELSHCISAFTGNSGVGKSTLINLVAPELIVETGETSKKLGRGRHTTRHVELYELNEDTFVVDTPGFSTFEMERYNITDKDSIVLGFREFDNFVSDCKFIGCSHTCEKGCAIIKAVHEGKICKTRHDSYVSIFNEIKDIKPWQKQKNV